MTLADILYATSAVDICCGADRALCCEVWCAHDSGDATTLLSDGLYGLLAKLKKGGLGKKSIGWCATYCKLGECYEVGTLCLSTLDGIDNLCGVGFDVAYGVV